METTGVSPPVNRMVITVTIADDANYLQKVRMTNHIAKTSMSMTKRMKRRNMAMRVAVHAAHSLNRRVRTVWGPPCAQITQVLAP